MTGYRSAWTVEKFPTDTPDLRSGVVGRAQLGHSFKYCRPKAGLTGQAIAVLQLHQSRHWHINWPFLLLETARLLQRLIVTAFQS